jgi:uncharacterized membrane protein YGL010W
MFVFQLLEFFIRKNQAMNLRKINITVLVFSAIIILLSWILYLSDGVLLSTAILVSLSMAFTIASFIWRLKIESRDNI